MTACYGYQYKDGGKGDRCERCGEHYYAHSHLDAGMRIGSPRLHRMPIRLNLRPGEPCGIEASKGMPNGYRSVYDRMTDRNPTISGWVARIIHGVDIPIDIVWKVE